MQRILIVEDSLVFTKMLKKKIESELEFQVESVSTYSEAAKLINDKKSNFFIGLLDLNLPDAPYGEIVDLVISNGIPAIVFTGDFSDAVREIFWSKKVVDYILKEGRHNLDYLVSLIKRIYCNKSIKILVAEDSKIYRKHICRLLKVHQYQTLEATNGNEAIKILNMTPGIKLVITDYNMPEMDGFKLITKIRETYSKEDLAIIGMSASEKHDLSARFMKNGANDFIDKKFSSEEFYCRVSQNITMIEYIQSIKDLSEKDYLTGLYNRRYFFESGRNIYSKENNGKSINVAMIDIDYFKKVNDTHGHDAGDEVLKQIGAILKKYFQKPDIVSRFGGEEFCILSLNSGREQALKIFENVRHAIEGLEINIDNKLIKNTISIGVCTKLMDSLDDMIKEADKMLYIAKKEGRNRVKES